MSPRICTMAGNLGLVKTVFLEYVKAKPSIAREQGYSISRWTLIRYILHAFVSSGVYDASVSWVQLLPILDGYLLTLVRTRYPLIWRTGKSS